MNKTLMIPLAIIGGLAFGYGIEQSLAQNAGDPPHQENSMQPVRVAPIHFVANTGGGQTGNFSCGG